MMDERSSGDQNRLSRRAVVSTAAAVVLGGCSHDQWFDRDSSPDESEPMPMATEDESVINRLAIEEWRGVNLVEQGADPEGETSITDILEEHAADDTLLYLPAGRYFMDRPFSVSDLSHFGIVGEDATITVDGDFSGSVAFVLGPSGDDACENVLFSGLRYDFTESQTGVSPFWSYCNGFAHVENIEVEGIIDGPDPAGRNVMLRLQENGHGIGRARIHRLRCPDGGPNAGLWINGRTERCRIHVTDSFIANFEDNGFYANTGEGETVIERCLARNNSISNFRLGGVIRDSRVVLDDDFTHSPNRPRGYWLRSTPTRVENCTLENTAQAERGIEILDTDCVIDGLDVAVADGADNTVIHVHDEGEYETTIRAVRIEATGIDTGTLITLDNTGTMVSDLTIRSENSNVRPVRVMQADRTTFSGIDIRQDGAESSAFWFSDESSTGGTIRDSTIDIAGSDYDVRVDIPDVVIENTDAEVWFDQSRNGVRGTINDFGTNDGDPNETGAWNGNGNPGIIVEDTQTGELYIRTDNDWRPLE